MARYTCGCCGAETHDVSLVPGWVHLASNKDGGPVDIVITTEEPTGIPLHHKLKSIWGFRDFCSWKCLQDRISGVWKGKQYGA